MTDKITLTDIANLQNETTVVNAINNNNAAIVAAMDNTLSRDGTSPNQMSAPLDMNSQPILNLPAPNTGASPVRLEDLVEFAGGGTLNIVNVPAGGTTHQGLVKTSNTDYDMGWSSTEQIPTGGASGASLIKNSSSNYDVSWAFPSSNGVSSYNGRTGAVTTQPGDFAGQTLLYEGLQPLKRIDLGNFHIGVNPGCFSDSGGAAVYNSPDVLVCDLSRGTIDTTGTNPNGSGGTPSHPIMIGCCLSPGPLVGSTSAYDGLDEMLYLCKRNSDNKLVLVADNSNVYGGSTPATIANGSNSWSTGGPPTGFFNGIRVGLTVTGGSLPGGFATATDYWVVSETNGQNSTTFGLASSYGGTPITASTAPTGACFVHYGVQDHLDSVHGAGIWSVLRGVHFAWRWKWQWAGAGGGIPDFTQDPRCDRVNLTYGGTSTFAVNSIAGSGLATSPAAIDCTNVLSNLNRLATIRAVITSTGTAGTVYIGPSGSTALMRPMGEGPTAGTSTTYGYSEIATDSTGLMSYYVTGGAKLLNVYIEGWTFVDPR